MFLKVIEWAESAPDVIVWKFPVGKNTIERGSSLTVREGQAVVFCDKGRMADVFGPGMASPVRVEFFGDEVDTARCACARTGPIPSA